MNIQYNKKYYLKWIIVGLFYLLIALAMYMFYKREFIWNGDDIYYHFQRIMGLSANWTNGMLYSNISPFNFGDFGYGVNIFYPWLTLLPFQAAFGIFGSWVSAYYKTLFFYFFISLMISHYSMKTFSGSTRMAILFAVIYNFSTYRLIELYTRSSLAEYIATIFLPLCFLGFYQLFFGNGKHWKSLTVGMSFIILSHVLSTFLTIIMFILIIVIFISRVKITKPRLLNLFKAIMATIFCTMIYTVPFLLEETFQKYGVPDRQVLKGQKFNRLIIDSLNNNSLRSVENNTYNIGLILFITLIIGLLFFIVFPKVYKGIYIVFLLTFILSTNLFPWHTLQNTPIEVIQFPYRLLMFVTLFGSIITAWIINRITRRVSMQLFPIVVCLVVLLAGGLWMNSISSSSDNHLLSKPNLVITKKMINKNKIPNSYLEQYIPKKSQMLLYTMIQHQIYVNDNVLVQRPKVVNSGNDFYISSIKKGDVIDLPFVHYKFTNAEFNGKSVPIKFSKRGSVQIIAPKSSSKVTIHMTYGNKMLFRCIFILTILGWIWMIGSTQFIRIYKSFWYRVR